MEGDEDLRRGCRLASTRRGPPSLFRLVIINDVIKRNEPEDEPFFVEGKSHANANKSKFFRRDFSKGHINVEGGYHTEYPIELRVHAVFCAMEFSIMTWILSLKLIGSRRGNHLD